MEVDLCEPDTGSIQWMIYTEIITSSNVLSPQLISDLLKYQILITNENLLHSTENSILSALW